MVAQTDVTLYLIALLIRKLGAVEKRIAVCCSGTNGVTLCRTST